MLGFVWFPKLIMRFTSQVPEIFKQSLLYPVVLQKRKSHVFWSSYASCPLQMLGWL